MHSRNELISILAFLLVMHLLFPSFDRNWITFGGLCILRFVVCTPGHKSYSANVISILIGVTTITTLVQAVFYR